MKRFIATLVVQFAVVDIVFVVVVVIINTRKDNNYIVKNRLFYSLNVSFFDKQATIGFIIE